MSTVHCPKPGIDSQQHGMDHLSQVGPFLSNAEEPSEPSLPDEDSDDREFAEVMACLFAEPQGP